MSKYVESLAAVIGSEIQNYPVIHGGVAWCGLSTKMLAEKLGVSEQYVRRLVSKPPFQRRCIGRGAAVQNLVRIDDGKPIENTANDYKNIAAKLFEAKFGRKVCNHEKKLLWWFFNHLPGETGLQIFKYCIRGDGWVSFMAGVEFDPEYKGQKLYLERPSISVINLFWRTAHDSYLMQLQEDGEWAEANKMDFLIA